MSCGSSCAYWHMNLRPARFYKCSFRETRVLFCMLRSCLNEQCNVPVLTMQYQFSRHFTFDYGNNDNPTFFLDLPSVP